MGALKKSKEIKKYLETNENENMTIQNPRDTAKAVLRGKFIAIQSQETRKISNNLTLHLKQTEKEEQTKPKLRRKEIIKIRAEINEIETKKTREKINETKSWFFEKINKIDKPLARLIKEKERAQINKIRDEKSYNGHHRNTKDHKRLLQATICQ